MKKIFIPLLFIAALFLLPACSEKFNVAAPYKSITVIYGLLDKADTAHYIRIQKAFLDQNKSALVMAKVPDSSFFSNIDARIELISMIDGSVFNTIHLTRVDLGDEGYPKDGGSFFNSPNYAYKFKDALDPNYIYRIVVTNNVSGETDSADAPVIDDLDNTVFNIPELDDTGVNLAGMEFASTSEVQFFDLSGSYNPLSSFSFQGSNSPIGVLQAIIRFNWVDSNMQTGVLTRRSYDYNVGFNSISRDNFDYHIKNRSLYNAIITGMGKADQYTARLMDRTEVFIYAGTNDFNTYLEVASIQGTGLTGNEIEPTYTNIQGKNVLGLYTSRGVRSGMITITPATIDSLVHSSLTDGLNIQGTIYH